MQQKYNFQKRVIGSAMQKGKREKMWKEKVVMSFGILKIIIDCCMYMFLTDRLKGSIIISESCLHLPFLKLITIVKHPSRNISCGLLTKLIQVTILQNDNLVDNLS